MEPLIGRSVGRKEDHRFLTGAGSFIDDVNLPGQAHACFVRSPHAHARIVGIAVAAAKSTPGVLAILTGDDFASDGLGALGHYANGADHLDPSKPSFAPENILHDPLPQQFPIVRERVRHVGEIVAIAVAETADAARDAAERIDVTYEPLPAVTDALEAAAPGAHPVWAGDNVCVVSDNGDAVATDAAFARADRVVRLKSHNHRVGATPLEPRGGIGEYDAATGTCTLHAPSQGVHRYKGAVASVFETPTDKGVFGAPPEKVRVITRDVGGGFGGRSSPNVEYPLLVWASRRVGRAVKWTATRGEAMLSDFQARDVHGEAALALDTEGRFLALRLDYTGNLGAYPVSFAVLSNLLRMAGGPYVIPDVHVAVRGVFSNTIPVSVYRGAGRPEVTFLVERLIDLAAGELGIDRAELRRRNLIPPEAIPYQSPLGHGIDSGAFADNMETACRRIDWGGFPERRESAARRGMLAGIGIANYLESPTGAPNERTDITVLPEGRIEAVIGTQASGQGHETSFAQVVAETLQLPFDNVSIVFGDSARAVSGGGSHSDRSMRLGGTVLVRASEDIIATGRERAAELLEAAETDIAYADGKFTVTGTDRSIGIFEIAEASPLEATSEITTRLHAHPNGVAACEVEIDPGTGAVQITRYATVDDVGRVINPMIVDGQVHGGIAQGIGQAMMEHCVYAADTGQLLSGSFTDYAMPRADHFPSLDITLNGLPAPSNPLGVKGAGECGTTPAGAALVGAVADALGVDHLETPVTAERVWRALRSG